MASFESEKLSITITLVTEEIRLVLWKSMKINFGLNKNCELLTKLPTSVVRNLRTLLRKFHRFLRSLRAKEMTNVAEEVRN